MCTSPLFRFNVERFDRFKFPYRNPSGTQQIAPLFIGGYKNLQEYYRTSWQSLLERKVYQRIPCGQCLECRISRSKEWADRCTFESLNYPYDKFTGISTVSFVTLTIDQEHLYREFLTEIYDIEKRDIYQVPEVSIDPFQQFMRRLRRMTGEKMPLRYFACSEYGSKNARPHSHMILYGFPLRFSQMQKIDDKVDGVGAESLYYSPELTEAWGKGMVAVAPFSWATSAYIARYTTKKLLRDERKEENSRFVIFDGKTMSEREFRQAFLNMSRKPGIGESTYSSTLYETDSIAVPNGFKSHLAKPPRYFDKKLKLENPELYEKVHAERQAFSLNAELCEMSQTDLPYDDFLDQRAKNLQRKLLQCQRPL